MTTPFSYPTLLLAALLASLVPSLSAQPANILIAQSKKGEQMGPCEPTIAINPTNTNNIAAGAILDRYYWSDDGGGTWQSNKLASPHGVFGDPVMVADNLGNFYYAHLSDPEKGGWSSPRLLDRIVIQKSEDGGKTYNDGTYVGLSHPKDQDKQWLCVDPRDNTILCTWTEFDKYNSPDENDRSRILFAKSADGAKTWSKPVAISQFEGDCLDDDLTTEGAVPAAGPNGEVYVAWAWNSKIWFDRSLDGGQTWLDKDIVVAKQPGGWTFDIPGIQRCNGMPVLVCDLSNGPHRGTLYVNWSDQKRGKNDTDIWVSKSTNGGKSWSRPIRVNDDRKGKHQFLSWLAIDQTSGYLYVVFYDRREYSDERTDVYLAVSRDGGKTFTNEKISESPFDPSRLVFFGDYNHISAHAGVVRPIWTRMEKGVLSVWTAIWNEAREK
ncbi:MAG: sialidase family protein [Saprospiraceae bacterium]|nr:sialidase family protein [Saprospiraceae bacterium]